MFEGTWKVPRYHTFVKLEKINRCWLPLLVCNTTNRTTRTAKQAGRQAGRQADLKGGENLLENWWEEDVAAGGKEQGRCGQNDEPFDDIDDCLRHEGRPGSLYTISQTT